MGQALGWQILLYWCHLRRGGFLYQVTRRFYSWRNLMAFANSLCLVLLRDLCRSRLLAAAGTSMRTFLKLSSLFLRSVWMRCGWAAVILGRVGSAHGPHARWCRAVTSRWRAGIVRKIWRFRCRSSCSIREVRMECGMVDGHREVGVVRRIRVICRIRWHVRLCREGRRGHYDIGIARRYRTVRNTRSVTIDRVLYRVRGGIHERCWLVGLDGVRNRLCGKLIEVRRNRLEVVFPVRLWLLQCIWLCCLKTSVLWVGSAGCSCWSGVRSWRCCRCLGDLRAISMKLLHKISASFTVKTEKGVSGKLHDRAEGRLSSVGSWIKMHETVAML